MFSAEDFSSIHLSPDDPEEVFDIMESLGTGNYGQVLKARNRQSEEVVAIKQIMLSDRSELQGILREVVILEKCDHRNIVRYFGTYLSMGKLWMAMEYCEGGCVEAIFQDLHHPMPEKLIAYISHEVLCGLQYVHQHRRLHRDIKGANILLTADGQVKLADFGVSTELMHTLSRRNTFIGTVMWMAPEAIMEIDYDDKADLWSLGITVIELAEGAPPNQGMHLSRAIWAIPRMDPPTLKEKDLWSPQMHFFIKRLLTKDRNMRPDAAAILNDPFVQVENIGTAEEMRELLRQVQERKRLSRNTNHLRRGEFSETATFIQRGSSSGSSSGNSSSESSDGDDSGGGADDSEHRRSSVKSVSKTKEKSSPRTHHHRGAHGSVSEGASAEAHPSAGVVSTAEAAVSAHHHVDAEPLREASLFGAIVPIPLLSTQDMSLDELAHCDGAGDAGLSLHEVQRLIEGESASSATIAPMSRAPDYLLHITRTLQYALQYHQQLPYVRGVRKAEATKAQAMQAKYGTALKTVYRL